MNAFYLVILSLMVLGITLILASRWPLIFIETKKDNEIRKIHQKNVLKIGGIALLTVNVLYFYLESNYLQIIILYSIPVFLIGFIDDLFDYPRAKYRAIILLVIILFFLLSINQNISEINIDFVDRYLLALPIISFLFTAFCILLLTNGFNVIDGQHGLMLGVATIIMLSLIQTISDNFFEINQLIICLLSCTVTLFFINFISGRILSGDCGSNFLGFFLGSIIVYSYNILNLDPFYIACILAYPIIEITFSFLRRLLNKKHPFYPDNLHFHSLTYIKLEKSLQNLSLSKDNINRLTTVIILIPYGLFVTSIHILNNLIVYEMFLLIFILIYFLFYKVISRN